MMKIWYITNLPAPYTVEFFNELGKMCSLKVIYERRSASDRDEKWKTDENSKSFSEFFLKGKNVGGENSVGLGLIKFFKKNCKEDKPDAIIFGDYGTYSSMLGIMYLKRRHIPYVISTDGGFPNYEEPSFKTRLKRSLIGGASWWFSSGGETNNYLEYYGAQKGKITQYPFTSLRESDILDEVVGEEIKTAIRAELGMPNGRIFIGVGQFIKRKGWDVLIKAFERIRKDLGDISLYIVGGEQELLEGLFEKEVPNGIFVVPFLTKIELYRYYKAADCFVLPTREDIWGLVVNEAMAAGLPVITTNRCNAGIELVHDGVNGYLVESDNDETLRIAMETVLELSGKTIHDMGRMSLQFIREYTYDNMAKAYIDGLEKYISEK